MYFCVFELTYRGPAAKEKETVGVAANATGKQDAKFGIELNLISQEASKDLIFFPVRITKTAGRLKIHQKRNTWARFQEEKVGNFQSSDARKLQNPIFGQ